MPQQYLHIELSKDYTLDFKIHDTPIADLWLERMELRHPYPIDHPDRFYGFNSREQEINRAKNMIQDCIAIINSYQPIIEQEFTDVYDQDCLNYLHSIFERYHGLLNQQKTIWWLRAPQSVKRALADLNLAVHRCESCSRSNPSRFVCTWYGVPKDVVLPEELMVQYGQLSPAFGSVYLGYTEIGKTLCDLTLDNDKYISDDAFKPFNHYSPDFVVRMFEHTPEQIDKLLKKMQWSLLIECMTTMISLIINRKAPLLR
jgi:hypothetical protein